MAYDHRSRPNQRRAAALLEILKGRLVDASGRIEHATAIQAATATPHWRLSNVGGVHVYDTDRGWYADIAFEDLPVGVPTVIGNAVPCGTREEAMRRAVQNLSFYAEREKATIAVAAD